jgi:hypothetical protein
MQICQLYIFLNKHSIISAVENKFLCLKYDFELGQFLSFHNFIQLSLKV